MYRIFPPMLLLACDPIPSQDPVPDDRVVAETLEVVRPGPLIALVDDALEQSFVEARCPVVEIVDETREVWTGGCIRADGAVVEGVLEIQDNHWISGENFSITLNGVLETYLDGAIELWEQNDLLLIDAAATWCHGEGCIAGPVAVDLSYSIFPEAGYPDAYDATISGVVAPDAPIAVEGSWRVDLEACASEPASGSLALHRGDRHELVMDGADNCDACVAWSVQGAPVPSYCGAGL